MITVRKNGHQADLSPLKGLVTPQAVLEPASITGLLRQARAAAGHQKASFLVEQALPLIYRRCGEVLSRAYPSLRSFDRDALVQDSVVKVWAALAQYDVSRGAEGWIAKITLNTARDFFRRSARLMAVPPAVFDSSEEGWRPLARRSEQPETTLMEREIEELALRSLPRGLLDTALLRSSGLNSREISERQGIPPSTVRGRLVRIRRMLEHLLGA